jgi:hypothetical protein
MPELLRWRISACMFACLSVCLARAPRQGAHCFSPRTLSRDRSDILNVVVGRVCHRSGRLCTPFLSRSALPHGRSLVAAVAMAAISSGNRQVARICLRNQTHTQQWRANEGRVSLSTCHWDWLTGYMRPVKQQQQKQSGRASRAVTKPRRYP